MAYLKERFQIYDKLNNFKNKDAFQKFQDDQAKELNYFEFDKFLENMMKNTLDNMKQLCVNKHDSYLSTVGESNNLGSNEALCDKKHLILPKLEVRNYILSIYY